MSKKNVKDFVIEVESNFDSFVESFEELDSYLQGDVLSEEEKRILMEELTEEDWTEIAYKIAKNLCLEGQERVEEKE